MMQRGSNSHNIVMAFVVLGVLLLGALWLIDQNPETDIADDGILETWTTYRNERFGFTLMYPPNWEVAEAPDDLNGQSPKFTFYKPNSFSGITPPFDHFAEAAHVSVYPEGIPTEGVFGETQESNITLEGNPQEVIDYVLRDGTAWATFVSGFSDAPPSWGESGFLWAKTPITNLATRCMRGDVEVSQHECDPFVGDLIVREGSVDDELHETEIAILESFAFLETNEDEDGVSAISDRIRLNKPSANEVIESPLVIEGEARGTWYFEASFPVILTNWDGLIIAEGFAEAQGDWMTEEFVPFEGTVEFESPYQEGDPDFMRRGSLILQKANPSGLPENDAALEISVRFE